MKISVVISTYKRPGLAENLKKQIQKFESNSEVIIIDQTHSTTPNTSLGKNQGIRKSTGDIIIFFDDDIEIFPRTISSLTVGYENPDVLGVAGRVINDGEIVPQKTQVDTGKMNVFGTKFTKNFWGEKSQIVSYPYGCNWSVRRSILEKVGQFDTKFPAPLSAFEEVDLGLRISRVGKIIFLPDALVFHHRAPNGGTRVDNKTRNNMYYQSYGRLIKKHIKFPAIILSILILCLRIIKETPKSLPHFFNGLISGR